jgi:hypothetical protein
VLYLRRHGLAVIGLIGREDGDTTQPRNVLNSRRCVTSRETNININKHVWENLGTSLAIFASG